MSKKGSHKVIDALGIISLKGHLKDRKYNGQEYVLYRRLRYMNI
jgi:hypothetical protein